MNQTVNLLENMRKHIDRNNPYSGLCNALTGALNSSGFDPDTVRAEQEASLLIHAGINAQLYFVTSTYTCKWMTGWAQTVLNYMPPEWHLKHKFQLAFYLRNLWLDRAIAFAKESDEDFPQLIKPEEVVAWQEKNM